LREKEATHPEGLGSTLFNPLVEEVNAGDQIFNPAAQRLQTQKSLISPQLTHLAVKNAIA
jgi:hypothetical protein